MVIFINGNLNSGKSTVSKLLAEKLESCAIVEIDQLREFIGWMPIDKAVPLNWENAICVIKNFIGRGLQVIVPYPLNQKYYEFVQKELSDLAIPIYFITLAPNIDVLVKRRGQRDVPQEDIDRIRVLDEKGIDKPAFGHIIDNSSQTPEETTDQILKIIDREVLL